MYDMYADDDLSQMESNRQATLVVAAASQENKYTLCWNFLLLDLGYLIRNKAVLFSNT